MTLSEKIESQMLDLIEKQKMPRKVILGKQTAIDGWGHLWGVSYHALGITIYIEYVPGEKLEVVGV